MVFVDLPHVSHSLETKSMAGFRTDWFRLVKHLSGPRRLVGVYAFDTAPHGGYGSPKQRFHDHLRYTGFRMVTRPPRLDEDFPGGELDVAVATEMLSACYRDLFDVALVVSGDRDLAPALERLAMEGKRIEVAALNGHLPSALRKAADTVHRLDDIPLLEIMPDATDDTDGFDHADVRAARGLDDGEEDDAAVRDEDAATVTVPGGDDA